jgi:transcriptional regulator with XRE-family HTH domain
MNSMTLGDWLKQYREQHKMSQPQLADNIGIEQSYLSKLENDKSLPSSDILDAIVNSCETTLDKLVKGLDKNYVYNQLAKLPQVKSLLVNQQQQVSQQSNNRLFLFGLLLSLGCFIFYLGYAQVISSNKQYQYYSGGILKADEALESFHYRDWGQHLSNDEYHQRFNPKTVLMPEHNLQAFVSNTDNERRYYTYSATIKAETTFNSMLKALAVLLFSGGFFGVILLIINRKVLK